MSWSINLSRFNLTRLLQTEQPLTFLDKTYSFKHYGQTCLLHPMFHSKFASGTKSWSFQFWKGLEIIKSLHYKNGQKQTRSHRKKQFKIPTFCHYIQLLCRLIFIRIFFPFFQNDELSGHLFSRDTLSDTTWKTMKKFVFAASQGVFSYVRVWDTFNKREYLYFAPHPLHMHLTGRNLSNILSDIP